MIKNKVFKIELVFKQQIRKVDIFSKKIFKYITFLFILFLLNYNIDI